MKAVVHEMPKRWLEERRASDASRWDEVWEGVLHMAPVPNRNHQRFVRDLMFLLQTRWAEPIGAQVDQEVNLTTPADEARWRENYRIPDLILVPPDRAHFDKIEYFAGPPLVCIEVRSPDDASYKKLDFYAGLGVPEVWIIDRDTKNPEVFVRSGSMYVTVVPDAGGWIGSAAIGVSIKGEQGKLLVRFRGDEEPTSIPK